MEHDEQITKIKIDLLVPNVNQPRKIFIDESIQELAESIKEYGILNPILVRKKDNLYEIIAGERRYRAAKLVGLTEVPVIIKNVNETQLATIALIENLQRENISPIEEAKSYQEIIKLSKMKEQELSKIIGKSQPYISNKLRLLKLPQNIQDALINKQISERHARSLISVNDQNKQTELLNRIINEKLSVKDLEKIINEKEITDEEIKSAIDDIMKSLNLNLDSTNPEKKEEKESDNMNNGNFFPNQPNNQMTSQNMTLNNMNTQTLNQAPEVPGMAPPVIPAPAPMPAVETSSQPFVYNQPTPEPPTPMAPPVPTLEVPNAIPDFSVPSAPVAPEIPVAPLPELSPMPEMTPPTSEPPTMPTLEVPNAIPDFSVPSAPIAPEIPVAPATGPVAIEPLFDQNITIVPPSEPTSMPTPAPAPIPTPEVLPSFEVPVEQAPAIPQDKLSEVEAFLNNTGVVYKKYSNETGHCLIIEL